MKSGFHYFEVGEREIGAGLYLTSVGCTVVPAGQAYPAPGHPEDYHFSWTRGRVLTDTALVFIRQGRGQFETRDDSCAWQSGQAVLLPPGLWHRYRPARETGWTELWLTLSGEWMGRFWQQWEGHIAVQPLPVRQPASFARVLQRFIVTTMKGCPQGDDGRQQRLSWVAAGVQLVAQFVEEHQHETPAPVTDDLVERARRFIWNHSHRPLSVKQVATAVGTTRRTLERHFAPSVGRSLRQELEYHRVQRARKLITETSRPLKEIAFLCGFRESRGLIRACQRWLRALPGALRRQQKT